MRGVNMILKDGCYRESGHWLKAEKLKPKIDKRGSQQKVRSASTIYTDRDLGSGYSREWVKNAAEKNRIICQNYLSPLSPIAKWLLFPHREKTRKICRLGKLTIRFPFTVKNSEWPTSLKKKIGKLNWYSWQIRKLCPSSSWSVRGCQSYLRL